MFSEKFGCCTIKIRKKIIKWSIFSLEVSFSVANGVIPSQAIPIFTTSAPKMRFTQSVSEKVKIAPVINNIADNTEPEIDELQQSRQCQSGTRFSDSPPFFTSHCRIGKC